MANRLLKNPWTWILLIPLLLFAFMVFLRVDPDLVVLTFGFLLFLIVSVAASKYALRAPVLIYNGDMRNEAINIVGWAFVMLGIEATQTYRWIFITLGRPEWLVHQYWSSSFVYTMFCGFAMVAWSTRRTVPRPPNGKIGFGGFIVGFATALGLMLSGILPAAAKALFAVFQSLLRAAA